MTRVRGHPRFALLTVVPTLVALLLHRMPIGLWSVPRWVGPVLLIHCRIDIVAEVWIVRVVIRVLWHVHFAALTVVHIRWARLLGRHVSRVHVVDARMGRQASRSRQVWLSEEGMVLVRGLRLYVPIVGGRNEQRLFWYRFVRHGMNEDGWRLQSWLWIGHGRPLTSHSR